MDLWTQQRKDTGTNRVSSTDVSALEGHGDKPSEQHWRIRTIKWSTGSSWEAAAWQGAQLRALWWPRRVAAQRWGAQNGGVNRLRLISCVVEQKPGFQGGSAVKTLTAMHKTQERLQVWSLSWEDSLEEGTATHSSILALENPWTEEPGRLQSKGSQRVGHDWNDRACTHGRHQNNILKQLASN